MKSAEVSRVEHFESGIAPTDITTQGSKRCVSVVIHLRKKKLPN